MAVAPAVEPVVFARPDIDVMVILAENFVGHAGVGHRRAEIIARLDPRLDFLAQAGLRFGRLDRHIKLRLLVFLHAEKRARAALRVGIRWLTLRCHIPNGGSGARVYSPLAPPNSSVVSPRVLTELFFASKSSNRTSSLAGGSAKWRTWKVADPHPKMHGRAGAINRAVGNDVVTRPVLPIVADGGGIIQILEKGKGHALIFAADHGVRLRIVCGMSPLVEDDAVRIGRQRRRTPEKIVPLIFLIIDRPVLVESDGFFDQRLAGPGVANIDQPVARHIFLHQGDVRDQHQQPRRLPRFARNGAFDQIRARLSQRRGVPPSATRLPGWRGTGSVQRAVSAPT